MVQIAFTRSSNEDFFLLPAYFYRQNESKNGIEHVQAHRITFDASEISSCVLIGLTYTQKVR